MLGKKSENNKKKAAANCQQVRYKNETQIAKYQIKKSSKLVNWAIIEKIEDRTAVEYRQFEQQTAKNQTKIKSLPKQGKRGAKIAAAGRRQKKLPPTADNSTAQTDYNPNYKSLKSNINACKSRQEKGAKTNSRRLPLKKHRRPPTIPQSDHAVKPRRKMLSVKANQKILPKQAKMEGKNLKSRKLTTKNHRRTQYAHNPN